MTVTSTTEQNGIEPRTTNGISSPAQLPLPSELAAACHRVSSEVNDFLKRPPKTDLAARVQSQTAASLGVIREALEKYSFDELAISFNGGKDCLVLLILLLAVLEGKLPHEGDRLIHGIYVMSAHPFAEVDEFVDACVPEYGLDLARYAPPMKRALETYLREKPKVKAIFVGTRRTDPHGELLTHFDMTDHGWPNFMRIHPVIDWHYQEIWGFLRELKIPYCSLYDMGYTSLGGTTDTHPNPALLGGDMRFRPAYELVEDLQERLGRDR